jgi:hypothetical protein
MIRILGRAQRAVYYAWFPVVYIATQLLWVSLAANLDDQDVIWRNSTMFSGICIVCLVVSLSARARSAVYAVFAGSVGWVKVASGAGAATAAMLLYVSTPDTVIQLYSQYATPLLAVPWAVMQAYVLLWYSVRVHSAVMKTVRSAAQAYKQTVSIYLRSNANESPSDIKTLRMAKLVAVGYAVVFAVSMVQVFWPWCCGLFVGTTSTCAMWLTMVLVCVLAFYSLSWEVNRGLMAPAVIASYLSTLVVGILLTDAGNTLNAAFQIRSADASGANDTIGYIRHNAALDWFAYCNSVRLWVVFAMTVYYCIFHYDDFTMVEVRDGVARVTASVYRSTAGRWLPSRVMQGWTKRSRETENSAYIEEDIDGDHGDAAGFLGTPNSDISDLELGKSNVLRSDRDATEPISPSAASTTTSTDYLVVHYVRMLLMVNYMATLLAHWGPVDTTQHWVTAADLPRMTASARAAALTVLAQQYYIHTLQLVGWVAVCGMYAYAMYCAYVVNDKYRKARLALFQEEFGRSRTAEVVAAG